MKKFMALFLAVVMIIPMTAWAEVYPDGVSSDPANINSNVSGRTNEEYLVSFDETIYPSGEIPYNSSTKTYHLAEGKVYNIYTIPMPEINEGSVFEDFTLEFSMRTLDGQNKYDKVYLFKLPGDEWDVTTLASSSDFLACVDRDNTKTYPADKKISSTKYYGPTSNGTWYRVVTDITEYANECLKAGQEKIFIAITFDSSLAQKDVFFVSTQKASTDVKAQYYFTPNAVYKTYAPLVVSSDASLDNTSYESTQSSAVSVGSAFKTAFKITNNTGNDKALKLVFACYTSANELVGLVFEDATAYTGSTTVLTSSALNLPATTSYVKAFVMDTNNNPITTFEKVDITQN